MSAALNVNYGTCGLTLAGSARISYHEETFPVAPLPVHVIYLRGAVGKTILVG